MAANEKRHSIPPLAIVLGLVLLAGGAGFVYLNRAAARPPAPPPPLTGAAREYVKYLKFPTAPTMESHESYLTQSVVEITGTLQNAGGRVLHLVVINCIFYDPNGHEVLRERVPIVSRKMGQFAPGDTKQFRLAFDNVPDSWNQTMPQMVIAQIDF